MTIRKSKSKAARQSVLSSALKAYLRLDSKKGRFYWVQRPSNRVLVGSMAGNDHRGYRRIRIFGHLYPEHELVWFFEKGKWPKYEIDHINGDGSDNRIENLRDVTHSVNGQNQRRAQKHSRTGRLGVIKIKGKFVARIMTNGKTHWVGTFGNPDDAHAAYVIAKRKMHEGCTL